MGDQGVGELWKDTSAFGARAVTWLSLDFSPPTLTKYGILIAAVWCLLWFLGRIYRGEIQNQSIEADLIENVRAGYYTKQDVLFTKSTMDVKSSKVSATLNVSYLFGVRVGDRVIQKKIRVTSGHFRLRMQRASPTLGDNQFAFEKGLAANLKSVSETRATKCAQRIDRSWTRSAGKMLGLSTPSVSVQPGHYEFQVRFRNDIVFGPIFILFDHPDSEVKATGWLTLLTSLFAVLAQFLFQAPHSLPDDQHATRPAVERVRTPVIHVP